MPRRIQGASGSIFSKKKRRFLNLEPKYEDQKFGQFTHSCSNSDFAAERCFGILQNSVLPCDSLIHLQNYKGSIVRKISKKNHIWRFFEKS